MQLCVYDGFEGFYNGFTVLGETWAQLHKSVAI